MRYRILTILLCLSLLPSPMRAAVEKDEKTINLEQGKAHYQNEEYDKARFYLLKVLKEDQTEQQALVMLLNIEERSGNYATAIAHANTLLGMNPYEISLWKKKISLYRLQHNDVEADRLLDRLHSIYPENDEVTKLYNNRLEEKYQGMRKMDDANTQIEALRALITNAYKYGTGKAELMEMYVSLANRLTETGRISEALDVITMALAKNPGDMSLIRKKAGILTDLGRYTEAYSFIKAERRRNAASPVLKGMEEEIEALIMEQAKLNDPYIMGGIRWEETRSEEALDFLISNSINRGYLDDAQTFLAEARKLRGDTPELLYKSYLVENRLGNKARAMYFLRKYNSIQPDNQEVADLIAAQSLASASDMIGDERYREAAVLLDSIIRLNPDEELMASAKAKLASCNAMLKEKDTNAKLEQWEADVQTLYKADKPAEVLAVADSALAIRPDMEIVILYKGLALEKLKRFDEAYECLSKYNPSPIEVLDHRRHLNSLIYKRYRNAINVEYQQWRPGSPDAITANASVDYSHRFKNDGVLSTGVKYSARDNDGKLSRSGIGFQLSAGYAFKFTDRFSGELSGAWSNRFFPTVMARAGLGWEFRKGWSMNLKASYRLADVSSFLNDSTVVTRKTNIFNVGVGANKELGSVIFGLGADAFLIERALYFNANAKVQYFPIEHNRSCLYASFGGGNAPESEFLDNSVPSGFSNINTFAGAGVLFTISRNMAVNLSGTWHSIYLTPESNRTYFYVNASIQISF